MRRLLVRVESGEVIGLGYVIYTDNRGVSAGLAGIMARNRMAAAGAMMSAAMATAQEAVEEDD